MNQKKPTKEISILILGNETHKRLSDLLSKEYKVCLVSSAELFYLQIKEADLVLVDETLNNWYVSGIIHEHKKEYITMAPLETMSKEDKKALQILIQEKAFLSVNQPSIELSFPKDKCCLNKNDIDKILKVAELLKPIDIKVVFPNGQVQEIEK